MQALNDELGRWTVDELVNYQAELALAVLSIARAGGRSWSIGNDEPTVALLRLSARLGLSRPEVATTAAAQLIEILELRRRSG